MIETIKYKKGVSYRARIYGTDGRLISQTFSRKEDAKTWERRKLVEREQAEATGIAFKENKPFKEFAEVWFAEKVEPRLSQSTRRCYRSDLKNHLYPILGSVRLRDITHQHAHRIIAAMRANSNAPKTINSAIGMLQGILNDGVRWGFLPRNPLMGLGSLKLDPSADRFWTPSEVNQFLRANLKDPLYPLYLVALNTGMRRGELAGMKWDRVRFTSEGAALEVTRGLSRYGLQERTKTSQKRVIPVNPVVRDALARLMRAQKSDFVFTEEDGQPLDVNHIYRQFQAAQKRAGIKNAIRFHDTRHTFASNFMMNGGNLYDLQKLLGHTSIKMTERYAHLAPNHLEKTVGIVSFDGGFNPEITQNAHESSEKIVRISS